MYPRYRYRQSDSQASGFEARRVESASDEQALGSGWYSSPADFGVETCPGMDPDPRIAANKPGAQPDSVPVSAVIPDPADDPGSQARSPQDSQPGTQAAADTSPGPDQSPPAQEEPKKNGRRAK